MTIIEEHRILNNTKNKKPKRGFVFTVLMLCNHFSVVALLIAYSAAYISPEKFWIPAFFGLTYPLWVIINAVFIIVWSVFIPKRALYSLLVLLCGWGLLQAFVQFRWSDENKKLKNPIKIMSYNVKLFDLYNWNHNGETRNNFFELIKKESPDILCLQEFYTSEAHKFYRFNNLDTLLKLQKAKNVFAEYTVTLRNTDHWGGAIFTVYPVIHTGKIKFEGKTNNLCMFCDVKISADTVRIYNIHLQSINFKKVDYKFLDDLQNNKETEEVEQSKNILKRLKRAYVKRAKQVDVLARHISSSPYPVIVCGDFNDTPSSYAYHTISNKLNDAFIESGSGLGRSYVGKFPSFRIDYILHGKEYKAYNFYTIEKELSDHYPVCCYLEKQ